MANQKRTKQAKSLVEDSAHDPKIHPPKPPRKTLASSSRGRLGEKAPKPPQRSVSRKPTEGGQTKKTAKASQSKVPSQTSVAGKKKASAGRTTSKTAQVAKPRKTIGASSRGRLGEKAPKPPQRSVPRKPTERGQTLKAHKVRRNKVPTKSLVSAKKKTSAKLLASKTKRAPKPKVTTQKTYDPTLLATSERYNIAGLFACLIDVQSEKERQILKQFFATLNLSEDQCADLECLAMGSHDPQLFAKQIKNKETRWKVLWDCLAFLVMQGMYTAKSREGLRKLASWLDVPWSRLAKAEQALAQELTERLQRPDKVGDDSRNRKWWKVGLAALAGAGALAATGGFAAPALGGAIGTYFMGLSGAAATSAGLAALGGGAVAAGGGGMAGGTMVISSALGLSGAGLTGYKFAKRNSPIKEFGYERLGGHGMHMYIAVPGWLTEKENFKSMWCSLPAEESHSESSLKKSYFRQLRGVGESKCALGFDQPTDTKAKTLSDA